MATESHLKGSKGSCSRTNKNARASGVKRMGQSKFGSLAKCRSPQILEVLVGLAVVYPTCTIFGIRVGAKRFAHNGEESCNINLQFEFRMLISE